MKCRIVVEHMSGNSFVSEVYYGQKEYDRICKKLSSFISRLFGDSTTLVFLNEDKYYCFNATQIPNFVFYIETIKD